MWSRPRGSRRNQAIGSRPTSAHPLSWRSCTAPGCSPRFTCRRRRSRRSGTWLRLGLGLGLGLGMILMMTSSVRRRLLALLLRHGRVYLAGSTWTQAHHQWLDALRFSEPAERQTFEYYRSVMAIREQQLAAISTDLRAGLDKPPIGQAAHRLAAYHAVGYLGGLTIAAEVANEWERFAQARSFMAFTGLVPSEHSSGDRRRQGGITKSGNVVIRTQLIESAWHFRGRPVAGKTLQERQSHIGPATVARASVAHQRLAGRYRTLAARGLPPKVINVAIARELAGFLWAEMNAPA